MARLRFPGRPGQRYGRSLIRFMPHEARNSQNLFFNLTANIQRNLKWFYDTFGDSDEEEDFDGFQLDDQELRALKLLREQEEELLKKEDKETLFQGKVRRIFQGQPHSIHSSGRNIRNVIRRSYAAMLRGEEDLSSKSYTVRKPEELVGYEVKSRRKVSRDKPETPADPISPSKLSTIKIKLLPDGKQAKIVRHRRPPSSLNLDFVQQGTTPKTLTQQEKRMKMMQDKFLRDLKARERVRKQKERERLQRQKAAEREKLKREKEREKKRQKVAREKLKKEQMREKKKAIALAKKEKMLAKKKGKKNSGPVKSEPVEPPARPKVILKVTHKLTSKKTVAAKQILARAKAQRKQAPDASSSTVGKRTVKKSLKLNDMVANVNFLQRTTSPTGHSGVSGKKTGKASLLPMPSLSEHSGTDQPQDAVKRKRVKVLKKSTEKKTVESQSSPRISDRESDRDSHISSPPSATKIAGAFFLPSVSARSSRVIKPCKRYLEEDEAFSPQKSPSVQASRKSLSMSSSSVKKERTEMDDNSSFADVSSEEEDEGLEMLPFDSFFKKPKADRSRPVMMQKQRKGQLKKAVAGSVRAKQKYSNSFFSQSNMSKRQGFKENISSSPISSLAFKSSVSISKTAKIGRNIRKVPKQMLSQRKNSKSQPLQKVFKKRQTDDKTLQMEGMTSPILQEVKGSHRAHLHKLAKDKRTIPSSAEVKTPQHSRPSMGGDRGTHLDAVSKQMAEAMEADMSPETADKASKTPKPVVQVSSAIPLTGGPRIKHVCRRASVALGLEVATFPDPGAAMEHTLSALPQDERSVPEQTMADLSVTDPNLESPSKYNRKNRGANYKRMRMALLNETDSNGEEKVVQRKRRTQGEVTEDGLPFRHNRKSRVAPYKGVKVTSSKRHRCKQCGPCQLKEDCGVCDFCLDKTKFGGPNTKRQACIHRKCWNPIYKFEVLKQVQEGKLETVPVPLEHQDQQDQLEYVNASMTRARAVTNQRQGQRRTSPFKQRSRLGKPKARIKLPTRRSVKVLASNRPLTKSQRIQMEKDKAKLRKLEANRTSSSSLTVAKQKTKAQIEPIKITHRQHRINIDFKEDYDIDVAWLRGIAILSSEPMVPRTVCYLCSSTGKHELIYCNICCEPFHSFCLEDNERPLEGEKENWCCRRCKFCHVCGRQEKLLTCDKCHSSYHPECLGPNYPTKPSKRRKIWVCTKCVKCKSCGSTTPGQGPSAQWTHDFSLCQDCGKLFDRGNYCPICRQCYEDNDYESKMMQCATCNRWVHAKCEGLTDDMYHIMTDLPESVPYTCAKCDPVRPAKWQVEIEEEMEAGFQNVLRAMFHCRSALHLVNAEKKPKLNRSGNRSVSPAGSTGTPRDLTSSPALSDTLSVESLSSLSESKADFISRRVSPRFLKDQKGNMRIPALKPKEKTSTASTSNDPPVNQEIVKPQRTSSPLKERNASEKVSEMSPEGAMEPDSVESPKGSRHDGAQAISLVSEVTSDEIAASTNHTPVCGVPSDDSPDGSVVSQPPPAPTLVSSTKSPADRTDSEHNSDHVTDSSANTASQFEAPECVAKPESPQEASTDVSMETITKETSTETLPSPISNTDSLLLGTQVSKQGRTNAELSISAEQNPPEESVPIEMPVLDPSGAATKEGDPTSATTSNVGEDQIESEDKSEQLTEGESAVSVQSHGSVPSTETAVQQSSSTSPPQESNEQSDLQPGEVKDVIHVPGKESVSTGDAPGDSGPLNMDKSIHDTPPNENRAASPVDQSDSSANTDQAGNQATNDVTMHNASSENLATENASHSNSSSKDEEKGLDDSISTEVDLFRGVSKSPTETGHPKDMKAVNRRVKNGHYKTVSEFCDDCVRIIQQSLSSETEQTQALKRSNRTACSIFLKHMSKMFPWYKVETSRSWEQNQKYPDGMLSQAVLPPHSDHEYAQWKHTNHPLPSMLQPSPLKRLPFSPTSRAPARIIGGNAQVAPLAEPNTDDTRRCCLCGRFSDEEPNNGGRLLYCGQDEWIHINCGLWSAEVFEEIDGSLINVHAAIWRGRQLRCEGCSKFGATVGCCQRGCPANFHFMCAREKDCVFQEDKKVFCNLHRDKVDRDIIQDGNFAVLRRVCVSLDNMKLNRNFTQGLEVSRINMMVGSLTVDDLGRLGPVSDQIDALYPLDFRCQRVYWSTFDARRRCVYTIRIFEYKEADSPKSPLDVNHTTAHSPGILNRNAFGKSHAHITELPDDMPSIPEMDEAIEAQLGIEKAGVEMLDGVFELSLDSTGLESLLDPEMLLQCEADLRDGNVDPEAVLTAALEQVDEEIAMEIGNSDLPLQDQTTKADPSLVDLASNVVEESVDRLAKSCPTFGPDELSAAFTTSCNDARLTQSWPTPSPSSNLNTAGLSENTLKSLPMTSLKSQPSMLMDSDKGGSDLSDDLSRMVMSLNYAAHNAKIEENRRRSSQDSVASSQSQSESTPKMQSSEPTTEVLKGGQMSQVLDSSLDTANPVSFVSPGMGFDVSNPPSLMLTSGKASREDPSAIPSSLHCGRASLEKQNKDILSLGSLSKDTVKIVSDLSQMSTENLVDGQHQRSDIIQPLPSTHQDITDAGKLHIASIPEPGTQYKSDISTSADVTLVNQTGITSEASLEDTPTRSIFKFLNTLVKDSHATESTSTASGTCPDVNDSATVSFSKKQADQDFAKESNLPQSPQKSETGCKEDHSISIKNPPVLELEDEGRAESDVKASRSGDDMLLSDSDLPVICSQESTEASRSGRDTYSDEDTDFSQRTCDIVTDVIALESLAERSVLQPKAESLISTAEMIVSQFSTSKDSSTDILTGALTDHEGVLKQTADLCDLASEQTFLSTEGTVSQHPNSTADLDDDNVLLSGETLVKDVGGGGLCDPQPNVIKEQSGSSNLQSSDDGNPHPPQLMDMSADDTADHDSKDEFEASELAGESNSSTGENVVSDSNGKSAISQSENLEQQTEEESEIKESIKCSVSYAAGQVQDEISDPEVMDVVVDVSQERAPLGEVKETLDIRQSQSASTKPTEDKVEADQEMQSQKHLGDSQMEAEMDVCKEGVSQESAPLGEVRQTLDILPSQLASTKPGEDEAEADQEMQSQKHLGDSQMKAEMDVCEEGVYPESAPLGEVRQTLDILPSQSTSTKPTEDEVEADQKMQSQKHLGDSQMEAEMRLMSSDAAAPESLPQTVLDTGKECKTGDILKETVRETEVATCQGGKVCDKEATLNETETPSPKDDEILLERDPSSDDDIQPPSKKRKMDDTNCSRPSEMDQSSPQTGGNVESQTLNLPAESKQTLQESAVPSQHEDPEMSAASASSPQHLEVLPSDTNAGQKVKVGSGENVDHKEVQANTEIDETSKAADDSAELKLDSDQKAQEEGAASLESGTDNLASHTSQTPKSDVICEDTDSHLGAPKHEGETLKEVSQALRKSFVVLHDICNSQNRRVRSLSCSNSLTDLEGSSSAPDNALPLISSTPQSLKSRSLPSTPSAVRSLSNELPDLPRERPKEDTESESDASEDSSDRDSRKDIQDDSSDAEEEPLSRLAEKLKSAKSPTGIADDQTDAEKDTVPIKSEIRFFQDKKTGKFIKRSEAEKPDDNQSPSARKKYPMRSTFSRLTRIVETPERASRRKSGSSASSKKTVGDASQGDGDKNDHRLKTTPQQPVKRGPGRPRKGTVSKHPKSSANLDDDNVLLSGEPLVKDVGGSLCDPQPNVIQKQSGSSIPQSSDDGNPHPPQLIDMSASRRKRSTIGSSASSKKTSQKGRDKNDDQLKATLQQPVKRGPGRPRKLKPFIPKRRPGRPRKTEISQNKLTETTSPKLALGKRTTRSRSTENGQTPGSKVSNSGKEMADANKKTLQSGAEITGKRPQVEKVVKNLGPEVKDQNQDKESTTGSRLPSSNVKPNKPEGNSANGNGADELKTPASEPVKVVRRWPLKRAMGDFVSNEELLNLWSGLQPDMDSLKKKPKTIEDSSYKVIKTSSHSSPLKGPCATNSPGKATEAFTSGKVLPLPRGNVLPVVNVIERSQLEGTPKVAASGSSPGLPVITSSGSIPGVTPSRSFPIVTSSGSTGKNDYLKTVFRTHAKSQTQRVKEAMNPASETMITCRQYVTVKAGDILTMKSGWSGRFGSRGRGCGVHHGPSKIDHAIAQKATSAVLAKTSSEVHPQNNSLSLPHRQDVVKTQTSTLNQSTPGKTATAVLQKQQPDRTGGTMGLQPGQRLPEKNIDLAKAAVLQKQLPDRTGGMMGLQPGQRLPEKNIDLAKAASLNKVPQIVYKTIKKTTAQDVRELTTSKAFTSTALTIQRSSSGSVRVSKAVCIISTPSQSVVRPFGASSKTEHPSGTIGVTTNKLLSVRSLPQSSSFPIYTSAAQVSRTSVFPSAPLATVGSVSLTAAGTLSSTPGSLQALVQSQPVVSPVTGQQAYVSRNSLMYSSSRDNFLLAHLQKGEGHLKKEVPVPLPATTATSHLHQSAFVQNPSVSSLSSVVPRPTRSPQAQVMSTHLSSPFTSERTLLVPGLTPAMTRSVTTPTVYPLGGLSPLQVSVMPSSQSLSLSTPRNAVDQLWSIIQQQALQAQQFGMYPVQQPPNSASQLLHSYASSKPQPLTANKKRPATESPPKKVGSKKRKTPHENQRVWSDEFGESQLKSIQGALPVHSQEKSPKMSRPRSRVKNATGPRMKMPTFSEDLRSDNQGDSHHHVKGNNATRASENSSSGPSSTPRVSKGLSRIPPRLNIRTNNPHHQQTDENKENVSGEAPRPHVQPNDGFKLLFEVKSDDGFETRAENFEEAWRQVVDKVQERRNDTRMKSLSFAGVDTFKMLGIRHDALVFLVEQLYGAENCKRYRFKFHQKHAQAGAEEEPPLNPHGCARAEPFKSRSHHDIFDFLASRHRKRPELEEDMQEQDVQHKSAKRATSLDLPMAMRFRHLKETAKEAVGVYRSHIHGRGLYCKRPIEAAEMVIEYSGNVIRSILTDKREKFYESKGIGCYMFRIDDFDVVDATVHGNAARFINHSCDPNCFSRVIQVDGKKHIVIFASRKIHKGEELTYDYKFPIEDVKIPCNCGAIRCRKYLN